MKLLTSDALENSSVVANLQMNRERGAVGTNSYTKDLHLNPVEFLKQKLQTQANVRWLDLCCGTGKALLEAAQLLVAAGLTRRIELTGIDLVGIFHSVPSHFDFLHLKEMSLTAWTPKQPCDLITCVHGLHYVGDKLRVIGVAAAALTPAGRFIAHLDLSNLRFENGTPAGRTLIAELRRCGLAYDRNRRLLSCAGPKTVQLNYQFAGADDGAGPNYTGQPAVDSYYTRQ